MPRIAVYAGSFDPITAGHLSVIERARAAFDRLVVLIAINPDKQPTFTPQERVALVRACAPDVECAATSGFVVEYARQLGARFLVRGVRDATDVESEIALAHANHQLAPEVTTFFLPAHPELGCVSSSRLKALFAAGADVSRFAPAPVLAALRGRIAVEVRP